MRSFLLSGEAMGRKSGQEQLGLEELVDADSVLD